MIEKRKYTSERLKFFSFYTCNELYVRLTSKLDGFQNERDYKYLYLSVCNVASLKHRSGNKLGVYSGSKRV